MSFLATKTVLVPANSQYKHTINGPEDHQQYNVNILLELKQVVGLGSEYRCEYNPSCKKAGTLCDIKTEFEDLQSP